MNERKSGPLNEHWIDLRVWRQFKAVAEELHFGRAAARLHMSQPPLTQAIALLESRLQVRLLERTKRRVALTAAGAALLPKVNELLDRALELPTLARAAAAGEVGTLRLGFVTTVGYALLPRWVQALRTEFSGVVLELIEATGDVQLQALARGEIDAGLMLHSPGFAPTGWQSQCVDSEPMVLALAQQHPLTARSSIDLRDVLTEPLVIFPRRIAPSLHDAIFALYHHAGQLPRVSQEAIQMQTIVNLVSAGLGVAWVPQSVEQFQRSGVVYRQVQAGPGLALPRCETSLVWPMGSQSPTLSRFVQFLADGPTASMHNSPHADSSPN